MIKSKTLLIKVTIQNIFKNIKNKLKIFQVVKKTFALQNNK